MTENRTPGRLGVRPAKPEKLCRTLKLANYLDLSQLTEFIPPEFDWFQDVPDYVDLNNSLGDCVVASAAKCVRSWTQNATGKAATITDAQILDVYCKGAGYVPGDSSTDNGWYLLDALAYWQKTGIGGHKVGAYAAINPKHHNMMRAATYLFGGLYIAFSLPISAQNQTVWDAVSGSQGAVGSWGGHAVPLQAIENDRPIVRTWGYAQSCTWAFIDKYCDEAYAIISPDYLSGGKTIAGLDIAGLNKDLGIVTA
jgi:hypothetical protein